MHLHSLQSLHAVTQFYSHYMQLHSSTVITCSYTVLQSYIAVTQFCSHNMQLDSSTVITCNYTVLQLFRKLHSFTIIPCSHKSYTVTQFYSQAVHFHSSIVMRYIYIFVQSFPTVLQSWCLIQGLSVTTVLCKMWNSGMFIISFVGYFAQVFHMNLTYSKVVHKSDVTETVCVVT
jgi:hypothetical protein